MSAGPAWFKRLSKVVQGVIEDILHTLMGFGARLVFLDYLLWRREAVSQWPPGKPFVADDPSRQYRPTRVTQLDRVADMMTDMLWYTIGGTCADLARAALVVWWVVA